MVHLSFAVVVVSLVPGVVGRPLGPPVVSFRGCPTLAGFLQPQHKVGGRPLPNFFARLRVLVEKKTVSKKQKKSRATYTGKTWLSEEGVQLEPRQAFPASGVESAPVVSRCLSLVELERVLQVPLEALHRFQGHHALGQLVVARDYTE